MRAAAKQSHRRVPARPRLPIVHETSAGGVVVRKIGNRWHVALLKTRHRRGEVWVLPKGHIEHGKGETKDVTALREVREELGIAKVRVLRKLGTVQWMFQGEQDGKPARISKTVHHYLMEGLSDRLHPQAEEGFLAARWVPLRRALKLLPYPTDRSVVEKAIAVLSQRHEV